ncbi:hypothetical protein ABL78_6881 [Leptomonas seymouri]|uniref:Uncharacterized protein n=1 Tax=Leptomonas seymouri TaxID=5684 RepID=A0A0N0P3F2_LEPSE|nr:hypothetical protein ABL78_6881 [Leptomonas seymouri]|eukprot:KPI84056.1 hypothetical protein ABL78_6881 [Leptomonas seymouri]
MHNLPVLPVGSQGERASDLWVTRTREPAPQKRLSALGRKPLMATSELYGLPASAGRVGARSGNVTDRHQGLMSHKTRPHTAEAAYVSLFADKFSGSRNLHSSLTSSAPANQMIDVDAQLADFVSSSLMPVSCRVTGNQQLSGHSRDDGNMRPAAAELLPLQPAMNCGVNASSPGVAGVIPSATAAAEKRNLQVTAPARFELASAENGDVVEHDALAGLAYWNAENPKTVPYTKPSTLLEAKEHHECRLFRRYSHNYEKLVADTAHSIGGEIAASIQASHKTFKAAYDAEECKPIQKRSFYTGKAVDWKKTLREQQSEMKSMAKRTQ